MTGFRGDETLTVTPAAGAPGIVSQDTITLDEIAERSPGGTPAGVSVVRAFPFAFDTPDLLTGAALYTPTPGDILLDACVMQDAPFDGTSPLADFGRFGTGNTGFYAGAGGALDLSSTLSADGFSLGRAGALSLMGTPFFYRFDTADPIKVCVSQDGTNTGDDPASTQGAAVLYLVTATPA